MTLGPGIHFGPYEIVAVLGEGGMGTVYRAHDGKLNRDVAIKVLLPAVANDPDRLARFGREAQVLAALNHGHIAHLYGVEDAGGVRGLIMEFVEGPTLADRIATGPLPLDEALPVVRQIAEALQAAHDRGVIHRDLKPANIKLRPDGTVKVLDFGLAKALDAASASLNGVAPTISPTITSPAMMTGAGTLLGTAAYMSPEQARGQPADKRSDIWAFGCVVYEMLTGRRAFAGDDVIDTLAAVRHQEPDWTSLPGQTPAALRAVLRRCFEKDRSRRLADISTVTFVVDELAQGVERVTSVTGPSKVSLGALVATAVGVAVLAGIAFTAARVIQPSPPKNPITRFGFPLPAGQRFTNAGRQALALSPDGRQLAYVANGRLWIHAMDEKGARALTDAGVAVIAPAFSSDGRSLAFYGPGELSKVPAAGGTPVRLAVVTSSAPYGMSWSGDEILFADFPGGPNTRSHVQRISADGGSPQIVAEAEPGELFYGPQRLPGGAILVSIAKTLVDNAFPNRWDHARIVARLPSGDERTIVQGGSDGRYLAPDRIVYAVGGVVFAAPFDVSKLQTTGPPVAVIEGVSRAAPATGAAQMTISSSGTLAYVPGPASIAGGTNRSLAVFARDGSATPLPVPVDAYEFPRVSPASDRVVVATNDGHDSTVWLYDLGGRSDRRRLTVQGSNRFPIWSADGQRIAFQSNRAGDRGIFWQSVAGGSAERLTRADAGAEHLPGAWSPDRGTLLFEVVGAQTYALWAFSMTMRTTAPMGDIRSRTPITPTFSPDGKWLAYHTQEVVSSDDHTLRGARDTVWVRPFPFTNDVYPIAAEGTSHHPVWSRDGHELIYVIGAGQIVARDITLTPTFNVGPARPLDSVLMPTQPPGAPARNFDTLVGGRFISDGDPLLRPEGASGTARTTEIEVVLNWLDELRAKVPARR